MKKYFVLVLLACLLISVELLAQQPQQGQQPRPPQIQIPNPRVEMERYLALTTEQRQAENKVLLEMFDQLRVADVRDGLDWIGYFGFGSLDVSVRPLWQTTAVGIARTARYLPFEGPYPVERGEDYTRWQSRYYSVVSTYPWLNEIEPGDFMAIDVSGVDAGLMGSENTLRCLLRGVRGFVFNGGGMRDTDEVILQKIPSWGTFLSQSMVQARIRFDVKDVPVAIGGVAIYPGDIILADNDCVIVVPRGVAEQVFFFAARGLESDKETRRRLYEQLGWDLDETVQ